MSSEDPNQEYVSIPDWHMEIIEERMARYNSEGMEGTPLEEFEKEIFEELIKGFQN